MSLQSDSLTLAVQSAGATPRLQVTPIDCSVAPAQGGAGYDCGGALRALLSVQMRRDRAYREVVVEVTTTDLAAVYTATIDGTAVAYDAGAGSPADLAALVTAWAAAINADVTASAVVTAAAIDTAGGSALNAVRVRGDSDADFAVDATATGTAVLALEGDPTTARLRLLTRINAAVYGARITVAAQQVQATDWTIGDGLTASGTADFTLTSDGLQAQLDVSGRDSVRPYLTAIDGPTGDAAAMTYRTPLCIVAPGVL